MKHGSDGYNQSSLAYNFELFSGKKAFKYIRPLVGFLGTDESAYYGYFGLSVDLYFSRCKCFVLTPSLAVGAYEDGDQIRMGHTLEFRSGGDFMYKFRNNVRVGVGVFHISNAGLGYRNPGSEQLILNIKYLFKIMKTLVALFIIFFLFTSSNIQAKDSARFSVGVGVFNYMEDGSPPHNDQSGMINLEVHSGRKDV